MFLLLSSKWIQGTEWWVEPKRARDSCGRWTVTLFGGWWDLKNKNGGVGLVRLGKCSLPLSWWRVIYTAWWDRVLWSHPLPYTIWVALSNPVGGTTYRNIVSMTVNFTFLLFVQSAHIHLLPVWELSPASQRKEALQVLLLLLPRYCLHGV